MPLAGTHFDKVREVIDRAERWLTNVIPSQAPILGNEPEAVTIARPLVARIFTAWNTIDDALRQAGPQVAFEWGNSTLVEAERIRRANELIANVRSKAESEMSTIERTVAQLSNRLGPLARPPRPMPADAAQEAALGNLRSDLRMVLDATPSNELSQRMLDLVRGYVVDGNTLALWLLASTDWPMLYIRTRAGEDQALKFESKLPDVLSLIDAEGQKAARKILQVVEGPKGIAGAVVAMRALIRFSLDDLARRP